MRVVHVTSVHPATDTRILYKECATLAAAGHEVHLVAPGQSGQDVELQGVQVHYVRHGSSRLQRMVVVGAQAMSSALALRPDILHLHDPELLLHAPWARMRCRRVIFDMHEDLPKSLRTKHWIAKPLRVGASVVAAFMERLLLSGMEVVYAEDSYSAARPWIRNFITLHNMPIVAALAQYDRQCTQPPSLGYIGSITPSRGCLTTLEVLGELQSRGIAVAHDCVGDASPEVQAQMSRLIEGLKLTNVRLHGYQPADAGYRIIAGTTIGLAILHPEPNYLESYPTKMFEYMAMGIPVIVSNFPLYRHIVDETGAGVSVDPLDIKGIADTIEKLLSDTDRLARMGENGRLAVARSYSWEHESTHLLRMYDGGQRRETAVPR